MSKYPRTIHGKVIEIVAVGALSIGAAACALYAVFMLCQAIKR